MSYNIYMITEKQIRSVAKQIGRAINARKVILFGSHADGTSTEDSDVDLLIIADSELPRYKRSRTLYAMFDPYPFPMDLLVYTPEEIDRGLSFAVSFVSSVIKKGKELYVS